jgi:ankyrin repeat protein
MAKGTHNFEQDRIRIAQLLLGHGVDANAQDKDDETPLHLASYDGRVAIARALLDSGAATNLKGKQGRTPLHSVVSGRCLYYKDDGICVAQLLLEHGADVNAADCDKRTPLHLASYFGKVEIAQVLLGRGAAANSKDKQGRTPLHTVAEGGYPYSQNSDIGVTHLLLEHGADIDAPDEHNRTPLHLASYLGRVQMVLVLLNAGANTRAKDVQGRTPLHQVSQGLYYSQGDGVGVARLLLEHGADINVQDKKLATPSDLASRYRRKKIASLFLHYANAKIDQGLIRDQIGLDCVKSHD